MANDPLGSYSRVTARRSVGADVGPILRLRLNFELTCIGARLGYRAAMVISAEELGWIIAVGFAVAFAAELALSAYISGGASQAAPKRRFVSSRGFKEPATPISEPSVGPIGGS